MISIASITAITLHTTLEKRFPVVRRLQLPNWDLFLTVAFVFVAATRLEQSAPPPSDVDEMLDMVTEQFQEWKPDAVDAFEDCKKFYDRNFRAMSNDPNYVGRSQPFLSADILGMWTVWNLFHKMPESEMEWKLARTLGTYALHEFGGSWA